MDDLIKKIKELEKRVENLEKRNVNDLSLDNLNVNQANLNNLNVSQVDSDLVLPSGNVRFTSANEGRGVIIEGNPGDTIGGMTIKNPDNGFDTYITARDNKLLTVEKVSGGNYTELFKVAKNGGISIPTTGLNVDDEDGTIAYDTNYNYFFIKRNYARIPFWMSEALRLVNPNAKCQVFLDATTDWKDLSFYGRNPSFYNGAAWQILGMDIRGGRFWFDGNNDYMALPPWSCDFSNGMTILVGFRYGNLNAWSRIFDFGNGAGSDNILLTHEGTTRNLILDIYNGGSVSRLRLDGVIYEWNYFIVGIRLSAGTPGNSVSATMHVYRKNSAGDNAVWVVSGNMYLPRNITRNNNYFGKSNWPDAYFYGDIDFFIMFDRDIGYGAVEYAIAHLKKGFY